MVKVISWSIPAQRGPGIFLLRLRVGASEITENRLSSGTELGKMLEKRTEFLVDIRVLEINHNHTKQFFKNPHTFISATQGSPTISFFVLVLLRRTFFDHLLWSIFQSTGTYLQITILGPLRAVSISFRLFYAY